MTQQQFKPFIVREVEPPMNGERPLREIVAELWENSERLVHQELELLVAELDRKAERLKTELTIVAIGGSVMFAGVLVLLAALVLLLSKAVDPWVSALIVGLVVSGTGYALFQTGRSKLAGGTLKLEQTARGIQEAARIPKEAFK